MPDFIAESPLHSIMIGLLATLAFGAMWIAKQRGVFLTLAIAAIVITIGMVILERVLVTDNERLNEHVSEMVIAVRNNDVDALIAHVSPGETALIHDIRSKMKQIEVGACTITSRDKPVFELLEGRRRATMKFIAFGTANEVYGDRLGGSGFQGVILYFEKDAADDWRVVGYELFNARNGP